MLVIRAGQLIDGNGGALLRDAAVVVDGERIVQVGPARSIKAPPDASILDAGSMTLMPGMIDAHVHITSVGGPSTGSAADKISHTQGFFALRAYNNGMKDLMAGFTAVRSLSSPGYVDVALRDAINQGLVEGPRMRAAGQGLSVTGGHMDKGTWAPEVSIFGRTGVGDGPWECRRATREQLKYGADVIKINAAGGAHDPSEPWHQEMTYEEMAAICQEAHWARKRVAAHAHGGQGITDAIRAGLDSVEHGLWISEEQADLMAEHHVFYVPTISTHTRGIELGPKATGESPAGRKWLEAGWEAVYVSTQRCKKAGVKICVGTDAGFWMYHGENAMELAELVKAGFTPAEAIVAATRTGAECLDLDKVTGTIDCGKFADLVIVDGDPLADVKVLQNVEKIVHVFKGGRQVK